jgi:hypothetical protein
MQVPNLLIAINIVFKILSLLSVSVPLHCWKEGINIFAKKEILLCFWKGAMLNFEP